MLGSVSTAVQGCQTRREMAGPTLTLSLFVYGPPSPASVVKCGFPSPLRRRWTSKSPGTSMTSSIARMKLLVSQGTGLRKTSSDYVVPTPHTLVLRPNHGGGVMQPGCLLAWVGVGYRWKVRCETLLGQANTAFLGISNYNEQ